ncbi:hypothetical protein [Inquilinus limosus]|uniref:hypothetical protein n=1 Tax=Inquilinus limosus TaxID=171674 RepID=UPI000412F8A6|nr:hypothetical protein [Inquilinus limosus]
MAPANLLRAVALTAVFAALGGCQTLDDLDREAYQRACDNLGIQRGTPTYDQCMLQQQRLDNEDNQRFLDREALKGEL